MEDIRHYAQNEFGAYETVITCPHCATPVRADENYECGCDGERIAKLEAEIEALRSLAAIIGSLEPQEGFSIKRVGGEAWEWQAARTCSVAYDWHVADGCRCHFFNDTTPDGAIRGLAAALDGREAE